MAGLEGKFALVVQALRYLGKEGVGAREIDTLRRTLSTVEKRRLLKDIPSSALTGSMKWQKMIAEKPA